MSSHVLRSIVTAVLALAAMPVVLSQCRRPRWWPGRLIIWMMNQRHAGVTQWGLTHVAIEKDFAILDVGCGGGKTIQKLAAIASDGKVSGVDYSETSVAVARQVNAAAIAAGRVTIEQASVSRLPFPDGTFDLVSAVETHYYWPEPVDDLREIRRVLKPGGRVVLIAETYKDERFGAFLILPMKLLRARFQTLREHGELLTAAGFVDVAVDAARGRGWMSAVARKPVEPAG
jgi:SAM-dependent methyltransferase